MQSSTSNISYKTQADKALARIAPLWPLSRFVAVNPFVGMTEMPFTQAASVLVRNAGTPLALPPSYYRELLTAGKVTLEDLREAIHQAGVEFTAEQLVAALPADAWELPPKVGILSSGRIDSVSGSRWSAWIAEEISKWCTAYFDGGQALWGFPWKGMPLFKALSLIHISEPTRPY